MKGPQKGYLSWLLCGKHKQKADFTKLHQASLSQLLRHKWSFCPLSPQRRRRYTRLDRQLRLTTPPCSCKDDAKDNVMQWDTQHRNQEPHTNQRPFKIPQGLIFGRQRLCILCSEICLGITRPAKNSNMKLLVVRRQEGRSTWIFTESEKQWVLLISVIVQLDSQGWLANCSTSFVYNVISSFFISHCLLSLCCWLQTNTRLTVMCLTLISPFRNMKSHFATHAPYILLYITIKPVIRTLFARLWKISDRYLLFLLSNNAERICW